MKTPYSIIGINSATGLDLTSAGWELDSPDCPVSRDQLRASERCDLDAIADEGTDVRFLVVGSPTPWEWERAVDQLKADVVDHIDIAV